MADAGHWRPGRRAFARRGPAGRGPDLSRQADPHRRALCGRRRHRYHCPRHGRKAEQAAGPAGGGRQQGRRLRHHRHRCRGQGRARWLHAADDADAVGADQSVPVPEAALRPAQGPEHDQRAGRRATGAGDPSLGAGAHRARAGRICTQPAGQAELCLVGRGFAVAFERRLLQQAGARPGHARALQGRGADAAGPARWPGAVRLRQHPHRQALHPERQAQGAGGDRHAAQQRVARDAHLRRGRHAGRRLQDRRLDRAGGPGRRAGTDPGPARERGARDPADCRDAGAHGRAGAAHRGQYTGRGAGAVRTRLAGAEDAGGGFGREAGVNCNDRNPYRRAPRQTTRRPLFYFHDAVQGAYENRIKTIGIRIRKQARK
ncbi:protein of unknown function [Cupriavidus taiwanensis]|uniref:Uncharacterized protein n=1 Tax=Cupriavidus taiwanensis TaxID=164546 RepID=A0A375II64_9BURK|nr:hypothetical protein CBM2608_A30096 [Cupriavidus taiwanensis]SPA29554.1 hypothetical protein CBM2623_A40095 [Cupriavidus taiwanensis]SPK73768.1 protein of unknown function [Cupriavidus taiwanensis]